MHSIQQCILNGAVFILSLRSYLVHSSQELHLTLQSEKRDLDKRLRTHINKFLSVTIAKYYVQPCECLDTLYMYIYLCSHLWKNYGDGSSYQYL